MAGLHYQEPNPEVRRPGRTPFGTRRRRRRTGHTAPTRCLILPVTRLIWAADTRPSFEAFRWSLQIISPSLAAAAAGATPAAARTRPACLSGAGGPDAGSGRSGSRSPRAATPRGTRPPPPLAASTRSAARDQKSWDARLGGTWWDTVGQNPVFAVVFGRRRGQMGIKTFGWRFSPIRRFSRGVWTVLTPSKTVFTGL